MPSYVYAVLYYAMLCNAENKGLTSHLFPGFFGLENPCFCSCFGRNSSSKADLVISSGLESSNYNKERLVSQSVNRSYNRNNDILTFFAISIPISELMAVRKPCFVDAYTMRSLIVDPEGQV